MPALPAQQRIEREAEKLMRAVERQVRKHPQRRGQIVGRQLWGRGNRSLAAWAIREATGQVDQDTGRNTPAARLRDRLLRRPPATVPTIAEFEARQFEQRLARLRARGITLQQTDTGRWLRVVQPKSDNTAQRTAFRPVENNRELVQQRVARAHGHGIAMAQKLAKELGVPAPSKRRRISWSQYDPRLEQRYREAVARETARVAHDALLDTWRDAAWDRMEANNALWVRKVQPNACGACLALADGIPRPATSRVFYRHTRCRCIPVVWRPRGPNPPTGRELFDSLTEDQQDALFRHRGGRLKAQALRDGTIALNDLVLIKRDRLLVTDYVLGETATKDLGLARPGAGGPS